MYFTAAATMAACIVFFFMAGSYAQYYLQTVIDFAAVACLQLPGRGTFSPTGLTQWMVAKVNSVLEHVKSPSFCFGGEFVFMTA